MLLRDRWHQVESGVLVGAAVFSPLRQSGSRCENARMARLLAVLDCLFLGA